MSDPAPAVALLHGGGQGSWVWEPLLPHLACFRTILLDVPGCGAKRGRDLEGVDVDAVVDELLGDLDRAGAAKIVLVGHSLAGSLMPRMAASRPRFFSRLIYISCSAPHPGVTFAAQLGTGLHGSHPDEVGWAVDPRTSTLALRYRTMFCNDMDDAQADAFLAHLGKDTWPHDVFRRSDHAYDHLATIPSSYVVCERDMSLPPEWQRRFANRLHCRRIVSLDAGHQAMVTAPKALARSLLGEIEAR